MNIQERNQNQLQRLYGEVINPGDLEQANLYITPDRPDLAPGLLPEMTRDREGFQRCLGMFRAAFPDHKFDIEFTVAEGEKVVAYGTVDGTPAGDCFSWEWRPQASISRSVILTSVASMPRAGSRNTGVSSIWPG